MRLRKDRIAMSTKLERIVALISDINTGRCPNVQELCAKFEVAPRTLHDDIRFIRDRIRLDIVYDKQLNGYYNADPKQRLPEFDLTDEELEALTLSTDMLMEHAGPIFRVQLEEGLRKIVGRLARREKVSAEDVRALIRFIPGGVVDTDRKILRELKKACNEMRTVEIEYFAAHSGESSKRLIDPYKIIEHDSAWYAVAWCHLRCEVREFAVHRVKSCVPTKDNFQIAEGFDVDQWISQAFILSHGDGEHTVRIAFTPVGARFAVERRWHPTQQIKVNADGSCVLEFKTQNFDEVKRWVLPFGSGAEVLEPPELRERVMDELRCTLSRYDRAEH